MNLAAWQEELKDVMPEVIRMRRELHHHPERSGEEAWTQAYIEEKLAELGVESHRFADCHAVMGIIRNGDGPCVAIRADMDALPVTEKTGLPFASAQEGTMHACGHDAHMALALGSAMWLTAHKDRWHGTVKYFFEPEEETVGGGKMMTEQGCMENPHVDVIIGQHMNPHYEAGKFFAKPGFVSGASDEIRLTVRGKSCHGAYPESGVDAIVMSGQIVSALQTLVSRTLSPFDPAVVTIGTIEGGQANNIVCGEVKMRGTLRTLSEKTRKKMKMLIARTADGVAQALGGSCEVQMIPSYGAVYNDDAYYAIVEREAKKILGENMLVHREAPSLGVESFYYFVRETPGVYYDIGSGIGTALHTETFLVDEACLTPGVALQCASVLALLKETES